MQRRGGARRFRARALSVREGLGLILFLVLPMVAWGLGRNALERGNRLFRSGDARGAADIYAVWVDTTAVGLRASYNLGTALAELGSDEAERYLTRAAEGSDSASAQRAHYNLAYRLLSGVQPDSDPFSAIPLLSGAIDHNRAALRMDPGDQDARWNLALAVQAFGEVAQVFEEGPAETDGETNIPDEDVELAPSEPEAGGAGEELDAVSPEDTPSDPAAATVGVGEAPAGGDPGPLSEVDADRLLAEGRADDTEMLVRGLLWSQRPRSAAGEAFPGGRR